MRITGKTGLKTVILALIVLMLMPSFSRAEDPSFLNTARQKMTAIKSRYTETSGKTSLDSIYQQNPLHKVRGRITVVSNLSYKKISANIDDYYDKFNDLSALVNPELQRLHKFAVSYDRISRLRFHRGVTHLKGQKEIDDLIDHVIKSQWYENFMVLITENQTYEYMENQALQILISIHTASHFFEVPFPTLFCLLFQESKFDFKITSSTGAAGLGQLTRIGLNQINQLRQIEEYEKRLQAASIHQGNIYRDPIVIKVLKSMGFNPDFPNIKAFPTDAGIKNPTGLDQKIIQETQKELARRGFTEKIDYKTLASLVARVRRGELLPERYAAVHPTYAKVIERVYGQNLGNIYNPETNVFYSAMLLRYYARYNWIINGKKIKMRPDVSTITSIIAYNEGPKGVISYLNQLKREHPYLNLNTAVLSDLEPTFTQKRVLQNHPENPRKATEIFKHVWAVKTCACID